MRRLFYFLFVLCALFFPLHQVRAVCCCLELEEEKHYVTPEQILINEEGIFVQIDNEVTEVFSIKQDDYGIYISKSKLFWTCPKCKALNLPWKKNKCRNCGHETT